MLRDRFSLNSHAEVKRLCLGDTADDIIVIDNFYDDPFSIISLAEELDFTGTGDRGHFKRYVGERARISISQTAILRHLHDIIGNDRLPFRAYRHFDTVFTRFNMNHLEEMDIRQFAPHVDNESTYSAIIYLSDGTDEMSGGTAFYRHRETGIHKFPKHPDQVMCREMKKRGFNPAKADSYVAFIKMLMYSDLEAMSTFPGYTGIPTSTPTWDVLFRAEARSNRLVLFPALVFHSPIINATVQGQAPRLTQNLFFMPK